MWARDFERTDAQLGLRQFRMVVIVVVVMMVVVMPGHKRNIRNIMDMSRPRDSDSVPAWGNGQGA